MHQKSTSGHPHTRRSAFEVPGGPPNSKVPKWPSNPVGKMKGDRGSVAEIPRLETGDSELLKLLIDQRQRDEPEAVDSKHPKRLRNRGPRKTIFSDEFLRQLEETHGRKSMKRILASKTGYVLQTIVFSVMVLMLGLTPVIKEAALWDHAEQRKVQHFIPQTPYILHFGLSVIIANFLSFIMYGKVGVKDCWNSQSIFYVSRVSVFYAIGESMEMFTLLYIDGTTWKILNQLKLPLTAFLSRFLLKRNQSFSQWSLIGSISLSIIGYCFASVTPSNENQNSPAASFGIALGVINVLIVTFAGIIADATYKQVKFPFVILIAQGRLSACVCTILVMILYQAYCGKLTTLFFAGWNYRVLVLTFWLLAKDWSVTFVLKNLNSMWKAIGTAIGLCVTYTVANLLIRHHFEFLIFIFVLLVVVNIVTYTFTKREQFIQEQSLTSLEQQLEAQNKTISR